MGSWSPILLTPSGSVVALSTSGPRAFCKMDWRVWQTNEAAARNSGRASVTSGAAFGTSVSSRRQIVVFVEGTPWKVQQQLIWRSGSRGLDILSLFNGVAIQHREQGTGQALSALQADPTVEGVYDDRPIT